MAGKYEIKRAGAGGAQYMFNLKAGNGEVILTSELYQAKAGAENGIKSVQKNSPNDDRYERKTASNGQHYFVLVAGNGEVTGRSELYTTSQARDKGIESCKVNGPTTRVDDLT
jgi:uncharacterized protein YegP (UPF0339 family)